MSTERRKDLIYEGIWVRPDSGSSFSIDDRRRFRKVVKDMTDLDSTAEASLLLAAVTSSSPDGGRVEKFRDSRRAVKALRRLCLHGEREAFATLDLVGGTLDDNGQPNEHYEMANELTGPTLARQEQITEAYTTLLKKLDPNANDFIEAYQALTGTEVSIAVSD